MSIKFNYWVVSGVSLFMAGCTHFNEAAWSGLKSYDAVAHPAISTPSPSEKSITYDDYTKARQSVLAPKTN